MCLLKKPQFLFSRLCPSLLSLTCVLAGAQRVTDCRASMLHQVIKVITCCSCETLQSQICVCESTRRGRPTVRPAGRADALVCCDHEFGVEPLARFTLRPRGTPGYGTASREDFGCVCLLLIIAA